MFFFLQRLPFILELVINGCFILLFSLFQAKKIPLIWNQSIVETVIHSLGYFVPFVIFFNVVVNYLSSKGMEDFLRKYIFSLVVFIPLVMTWGDLEFSFWLASAHLLSSILALYETDPLIKVNKTVFERKLRFALSWSPAQIVLASFFGMIVLGSLLLMLPFSTKDDVVLNFVDAIFMSTSATCVTGLATISLSDQFSLFGQMVILVLIQVGGLGFMTLSSSMTILLGKSMAMKERIVMQDLLDVSSQEELLAMIVDIIKYTFFIELWGGIFLTIAFTFDGFEFGEAIYYGFFHSISAFCNAGFSLFPNSFESYATNPLVNSTIMVLITLGGFGFIVLRELSEIIVKKKSLSRITLHTKIVLVMSGILTLSGTLFIFFGEFLNSLDGYSLFDKLQISLFQSVTLRTAGFNTIPMTNLHAYTIYGLTLFMFIGASPGSTGGGIKTTTLAILIQSIKATLKGKHRVEIFDRNISPQVVVRVTALAFISIITVTCFILFLLNTEPDQSFLTLFFESISASGTVGLSLGVTPFLHDSSKLLLSFLMLIGRIGPLTLVLAIGQRTKSEGSFVYPDGRMLIG